MKVRTKFIVFICVIQITYLVLAIQLLPEKIWGFFFGEICVVISLVFSIRLYRSIIRPLDMITAGVESLKERDFGLKFIPIGQQEVDVLIEVYNRMIDQLRQERIYQQEQEFFSAQLIEVSPAALIVLDFNERISHLNQTATQLPGFEGKNVLGKKLTELSGLMAGTLAELKPNLPQVLKINGIHAYKCSKAHFMDRGAPHHFIVVEELSDELLKTEKKAYDKVIRMMAHEVNNSIGATNSILSTLQEYKEQLPNTEQEDFDYALEVVIQRSEHLRKFMANFAEVVRTPKPTFQTCELHQLLEDVVHLLEANASKRGISFHWDLSKKPLEIELDAHQFEQVLLNIFKNAMESIGQDGNISIITHQKPPCLIIEDDGGGIDPAVQPHIFTPFFSTKKDGQGIGLMLCREILLNHSCTFSLETIEEGRTQFRIGF